MNQSQRSGFDDSAVGFDCVHMQVLDGRGDIGLPSSGLH